MRTKVIYANGGQICEHEDGKITSREEYYVLSTDEKPIEGVENASILLEMDTGNVFCFDAENKQWHPQ